MSRLDDELKLMLRRQEPSEDFAKRVLAQIKVAQKPSPGFWQKLLSAFQPMGFRWAVAAIAIIVIAIAGLVQYQHTKHPGDEKQTAMVRENQPDENRQAKEMATEPTGTDKDTAKDPENKNPSGGYGQPDGKPVNQETLKSPHQQNPKFVKHPSAQNEERLAHQRKSEGEIAKEQLMKALFIASATVNEAKKLAMGDE